MVAYLDTNVYIGAKYQFFSGKFATLHSLILDEDIKVIYSSATLGEVEQHIRDDIKSGVTQYNRLLRKELFPLTSTPEYCLNKIVENDAVLSSIMQLRRFLELDGVIRINMNPLDAETLMNDYFQERYPFEHKKPYEFKDAIMINAVKNYQRETQEVVVVVSDDDGFRKAFEDDANFITVRYLSDLFRLCQEQKAEFTKIESCIEATVESDNFYEMIDTHFRDFDIDRGYYSEWECEEHQVDSIEAELGYVEFLNGKYLAHVNLVLYLFAEITHRDEETSYFDKEEQRYLIENFVTWREKHRIETDIVVECLVDKGENDVYVITEYAISDSSKFKTLDLDEDTLLDWDELNTEYHEEPDLVYCNECGKVLGYSFDFTDYNDNPLCDRCMVSNANGDICPICGRKVPHEYMNSGFCTNCATEQD